MPAGTATLADARGEAATAPLIYALGGVTAENAAGCVAAGAAGVAVMGGVMAARDPGAAVEAYLAALTADPRTDLGPLASEPLRRARSDGEPGGSVSEQR
jgi:thiamine-phosphate pyrophosphorylase